MRPERGENAESGERNQRSTAALAGSAVFRGDQATVLLSLVDQLSMAGDRLSLSDGAKHSVAEDSVG